MPIVNVVSDLITDLRITKVVPDPARSSGKGRCAAGTVNHSATDSANSTYYLCDIPADAILDSRTAFKTDTWNMGANVSIGTQTAPTALYNGAKGAAVAPVAFGDAKHGLPAWQQLGLAARPATGVLSLYLHGLSNATATGSAKFEVHYRVA